MTARRSSTLAPLVALLFALSMPSCGGAGAQQEPDAPEHAVGSEGSSEGSSSEAEESEAEAEAPRGPNCDDGTCSLCADSLCPNGWYCDEGAKACSWLRECPEKPSCACVTRVLGSSCKCSEEAGVPHVDCG